MYETTLSENQSGLDELKDELNNIKKKYYAQVRITSITRPKLSATAIALSNFDLNLSYPFSVWQKTSIIHGFLGLFISALKFAAL